VSKSAQPDLFHSPGEWHFDGPPHNHIVWCGPEQRVCFLTSDGPSTANARLISAAPDLLEACELAVAAFDCAPSHFSRDHVREIYALREAIFKATGKKS
jgi:hypothetical protein